MSQEIPIPVATNKMTIDVVYNGITKSLDVQPHETVQAALEQAMNLFGIHDQRHLMAFFREDGSEVTPENVSLEAAGITPGMVLALRPSRVKGGIQ